MCEALKTHSIATHIDHIFAPSTLTSGVGEASILERIAGVVLFILASCTVAGGIYLVYQANEKRLHVQQPLVQERANEQTQLHTIQAFWEREILPFEVSHGTTSLYHQHLQEHGISATYPAALHDMILRIRKVWTAHEQDISPKSGYFKEFEKRYDASRNQAAIAFSFSANPDVTQEYTRGARGFSGEWIRERSTRTSLKKSIEFQASKTPFPTR